ncbi:MAG: hypothetical protein Q4C85_05275, partial [Actinomyces sp.]|nr:hypothetical protein [Actinomyces sp.]
MSERRTERPDATENLDPVQGAGDAGVEGGTTTQASAEEVTLTLPAADQQAAPSAQPAASQPAAAGGGPVADASAAAPAAAPAAVTATAAAQDSASGVAARPRWYRRGFLRRSWVRAAAAVAVVIAAFGAGWGANAVVTHDFDHRDSFSRDGMQVPQGGPAGGPGQMGDGSGQAGRTVPGTQDQGTTERGGTSGSGGSGVLQDEATPSPTSTATSSATS